MRNSSSEAGENGLPLTGMESLMTPSRSRNTARREPDMLSDQPIGDFGIQALEREPQGLARGTRAGPAEREDARDVEFYHRDITLPAPVAAGVLELDRLRVKPDDFTSEFRDIGDRHGVAGRHVIDREVVRRVLARPQDRRDHIRNVDVGLVLAAIAKNAQARAVGAQPAHEIEADAVRLARADDVAEAEASSANAEHERVGRDQRFAGELARAVGRDR